MNQPKIIKKKVKPYPIPANLELNAIKHPVEIIYLGAPGVIVRLKTALMLHVGDYYQIHFEIPVARDIVTTQVRVLKTYDKTLDIKEKTVERLAELHFKDLTKDHKSRIVAFAAAIGQDK